MERARVFTKDDWAEHERYVRMFRAAKQRKREWQARRVRELEAEEAYVQQRRQKVSALFERIDHEAL